MRSSEVAKLRFNLKEAEVIIEINFTKMLLLLIPMNMQILVKYS